MNRPKVSIIIPVYNGEKYIKECLDSVLSQTYQNIEILIINDGSTDNTSKILGEYPNKKIKVISQDNNGVSAARNNGIKNASGDYITFLDIDDLLIETYINELVENLQKNKLDLLKTSYSNFVYNKNEVEKISYFKDYYKEIKKEEIDDIFIDTPKFNSSCMQLINSKLIKENNILFNEELGYGEDFLFTYSLFKKAEKIGYLNNNGYLCRANLDSASRTGKIKKQIKNSIDCLNAYQVLINNNNNNNESKVYKKILIHISYLLRTIDINSISYEDYQKELKILFDSTEWKRLKAIKFDFKEFDIKKRILCKQIYNENYKKIWNLTKIFRIIKK